MLLDRNQAEVLLRRQFGLTSFYSQQWEAVNLLLNGNGNGNGKKVFLIQKTSFGKSLCYQFPAVVFDGLTIVVCPLLSLSRDQLLNQCQKFGIPAGSINSGNEEEQNIMVYKQLMNGKLKILFLSPEKLCNPSLVESLLRGRISLVALDEAHCLYTWATFRPAYRKIHEFLDKLSCDVPILALTATATQEVISAVREQIGGIDEIIQGSLYRPNFNLNVIQVNSEYDKLLNIADIVRKHQDIPGIIYSGTIAKGKIIADFLSSLNICCRAYNGKMWSHERIRIENDFMQDNIRCVVGTSAYSLGVDKPNIGYIVHAGLVTASVLEYYQEIGRAGRGCQAVAAGNPADIYLVYKDSDVSLPEWFITEEIAHTELSEQYKVRVQRYKELQSMIGYAQNKGCRYRFLLNFFNENISDCKQCDNCKGIKHTIPDDPTIRQMLQIFLAKQSDYVRKILSR